MAKVDEKQLKTAKTANTASINRSKAYAAQVEKMFAQTVDAILQVQKQMPILDEGQMFSFETLSMKSQKEVEALLRKLSAMVTAATEAGIKLEWQQANKAADALLASAVGKAVLRNPHFTAWQQVNKNAMYDFINRKEGIMTLSSRIWDTTRQLREEMEVALTVGIGEGKSAAEMSRDVKKYLNDPDLMFRRFRYKKDEDANGNPIYGRKWKKLEVDANGKKHWIDYDKDDYKTGAGYYKSASKNAMRVTRTETNMAYRRGDQTRWQQFDFVLGYHVEPSKVHGEEDSDMCDCLKGDYPKDFIFEGWHPQCRCVLTPILMDEDEIVEFMDAKAEGRPYTPKSKPIADYPKGFKDWCYLNAEKLEDAHSKGKDPYFIRHNYAVAQKAMNGEDLANVPAQQEAQPQPKKKTVQEIAQERHDNRTEEEKNAILSAYQTKQKYTAKANEYIKDFEGVSGYDTTALLEAKQHADWDAVKAETIKLAQAKQAIYIDAFSIKNALSGIADVDTDSILDAIRNASLKHVIEETNVLKGIKKEIESLQNVVTPLMYAKQHSLQAIKDVDAAVGKTFAKIENEPLSVQQKMLNKEIKYVVDPDYLKPHKIYSTWEVAQKSYLQKLDEVTDAIKWQEIESKYKDLASFTNSSKPFKDDLQKLSDAIANKDENATNAYIQSLEDKKAKIEKQRATKANKNAGKPTKAVVFDASEFTDEKRNKAFWTSNPDEADDLFRPVLNADWNKYSNNEKQVAYFYTSGSSYINEPTYTTYYSTKYDSINGGTRDSWKDINTLTEMIEKSTPLQKSVWLNRGASTGEFQAQFGISLADCIDIAKEDECLRLRKKLQKIADELSWRTLPSDVKALNKMKTDTESLLQQAEKDLFNTKGVIDKIGQQKPFTSTAHTKGYGFVGDGADYVHADVVYNIYCPKGTKAIYAEPFSHYGALGGNGYKYDGKSGKHQYGNGMELEVIIQRGAKFKVRKCYYAFKNGRYRWFVDLDLIEQPSMNPNIP